MPTQMSDCFIKLGDRGLTPILRILSATRSCSRHHSELLNGQNRGVHRPGTASALTGEWGERTQRIARWLLERSAVHVLASDARPEPPRPNLSAGRDAAAEIVGSEIAGALVEDNQAQ